MIKKVNIWVMREPKNFDGFDPAGTRKRGHHIRIERGRLWCEKNI